MNSEDLKLEINDDLRLEINIAFQKAPDSVETASGVIYVTPPIDEGYWIARVKVSEEQAVVAFPKFGVFGIGFAVEEDWNTNLPSGIEADKIFDHIKHNKGDDSIPDELCVEAIEMLRSAIEERAASDD